MFKTKTLVESMQLAGIGPLELSSKSGISRTTIWSIMAKGATPTFSTAKRLAVALGINPGSLWAERDVP